MDLLTANRLLELRKINGYSQDVLAGKIGVSRQAISKWERAESSPDTDNLIALAELYGITLDDLLNTSKDVVKITPSPSRKRDVSGKMKSILSKVNDFGVYPDLARGMMKFPFALVIVVIYLAVCFPFQVWHPFWLIFMTIPIYYQTALACKANNMKVFRLLLPIPEIVVTAYLIISFFTLQWQITWILFLLIPIYYWLVLISKSK